MKSAVTVQGFLFSSFAILLSLLSMILPAFDQRAELIVLGVLICLLGVPHGAMDTVFAVQLHGVNSVKGWCLFGFLYLIPAILVVVVWHFAPVLFLLVFLIISVVHFSGDLAEGTPTLMRVLYGALIVLLPALRHGAEVTRLFGLLIGQHSASNVLPWLTLLGWPWLVCSLGAAAICLIKARWLTGLEILAVAALGLLADPLAAFTVFFCGMHSARHILRTVDYAGIHSFRRIAAVCVAPMCGFLVLTAAAWFWMRDTPVEARLLQLIFVGLAALTVPHMALVERVRFSGWQVGIAYPSLQA